MNSKKKGNLWENKFANWLRDNGIKAWKDGMSGGGNREKADVGNNHGFCFEVKAVKKIGLMELWRQVNKNASLTHQIPVGAVHFDGMPDNQWLMIMHSDDWIELIKGQNGATLPPQQSFGQSGEIHRELKYSLNRAIQSLKQLAKDLEKYGD